MFARGCSEFKQLQSAFAQPGRRAILRAGSLGLLGSALPSMGGSLSGDLLQAATNETNELPVHPHQAKACIFLFMWGGPSQLDTFDLKPEAPAEIRGEFAPIPTSAPGVSICEHFHRTASQMDKVAVIRSLNHRDPAHLSSGHATVTGQWAPVVKSDADPPSDRDTPFMGSMLAHLRPPQNALPPAVTMPWLAYHPAAPGGKAPGQHASWLGHQYDPLLVQGDPSRPEWAVPALSLNQDVSEQRLLSRQHILRTLEQQRQQLNDRPVVQTLNNQQDSAISLLTSPRVKQAFDIHAEPESLREKYGRNIHGQSVLLARRLVENGVPFVSVNWHNDGKNFWDTHGRNFTRLKNDLIPMADQALAALLQDLEDRGLLDSTIIAWVGEFGRRPLIDNGAYGGRPHWPRCYSGLLAGGGIQGGQVYGSSDKHAAHPETNPVSPLDYAATLYHALGIPAGTTVTDKIGRPHFVYGGKPIMDLFG